MKKIGILTFHGAKNYGAVLQGYALQKTIQSLGRECEIVDYECKSIVNGYKPFQIRKNDLIKSFLKSVVMYNKRSLRIKRFASFYNNYLNLSKKTYTADNINDCANEYYKFISGSDQVWGPGVEGVDPDSVYFLKFARPEQRFSYAASFGVSSLSQNKVPVMKKMLDGFSSYSVREESAAKIVKEVTGNKALVNVDPTFLLGSEEWKKIASPKLTSPYILVFNVKPVKSLIDFAAKLSKEKGIPVIYINDNPHKKRDGFTYIAAPSVEDFLGYILNAAYVVTNSFHGTAFSVIFHKNLFVEFETARGRNDRAENLLKKVGINREIKGLSAVETEIDWEYVDIIIDKERQASLDYLTEITE